MKLIDIFDENEKTLNQILEEYIIVTLQSIINGKLLYTYTVSDIVNKRINE